MATASKKKTVASHLSDFEKLAGMILLAVYLILLPLFGDAIAGALGTVLGISLSRSMCNIICFYLLFAVVVLVFHSFLFETSRQFFKSMEKCFKTLGITLVFFYGLNELLFRVSHLLWGNGVNLNDSALINDLSAAPPMTALAVVLLVPLIEEVLFRALIFGWLREHSRAVAYVVSCITFALLHTWQFSMFHVDPYHILLLAQYLVPGFLLTWAYDRSGSLWTSILVHAAVNALAVWTFLW